MAASITTRLRALRSLKVVQYKASRSVSYESLHWLSECKVEELKRIAIAIGSNSSGIKADLTANLQNDLQENSLVPPKNVPAKYAETAQHHVVSIDMGIRNLAYCRLALPPNWASTSTPAVPQVYQWERIEVSERRYAKDASGNAVLQETKEAFDPPTYAQYAWKLISKLLSSPQPTQILIERQRFRSMGGSAVQEWTLRVNMFESMLYAVLRTMSELGHWSGVVSPVSPAKVSGFWLGAVQDEPATKPLLKTAKLSKTTKTKAAKVDLVAKWLQDGDRLELHGQADILGQAFLQKKSGAGNLFIPPKIESKRVRKPHEVVRLYKLDDLADCLLQGMAWVQWEKNRRAIVSKGMRALHEL